MDQGYVPYIYWFGVLCSNVCVKTNIRDIDDLRKRLTQIRFDFEHNVIDAAIDQWRNRPRSSVHAGGGHFEHMLWNECLFTRFIRTFYQTYQTANVIWCSWRLSCSQR